uniref:Uncharacterized protein n=1 Tax=Solanum lycopersicum TaxID=4081 RepID=A0A3Q7H8P2_SOLLC
MPHGPTARQLIYKKMGKILGILILALCALICEAAIFRPISDSHRSAALELLTPKDGSFTRILLLLEYYFGALQEHSYTSFSFWVVGGGKLLGLGFEVDKDNPRN